MSEDPSPTVACSDAPRAVAWAVALGCGLIVGLLLAVGITGVGAGSPSASFGDPEYDKVPVIRVSQPMGIVLALAAGMMIGAAAAVAARSHPLLAALAASVVAATSSVATIVLLQWHRRWPVGTIDGRMIVVAVVLLFLICSAGLLGATAMSLCRRRPA